MLTSMLMLFVGMLAACRCLHRKGENKLVGVRAYDHDFKADVRIKYYITTYFIVIVLQFIDN